MTKQRRVLDNLKRGRQYLKSDYKVYATKSSTVGDHYATFALSDKSDKDFRQMCDREHNDICDECINLRVKSNRQKLNVEDFVNEDVEAFKEKQAIDDAVQRRQLRREAYSIDQVERATSPKQSTSSLEIPPKRQSLRNKNKFVVFFQ